RTALDAPRPGASERGEPARKRGQLLADRLGHLLYATDTHCVARLPWRHGSVRAPVQNPDWCRTHIGGHLYLPLAAESDEELALGAHLPTNRNLRDEGRQGYSAVALSTVWWPEM